MSSSKDPDEFPAADSGLPRRPRGPPTQYTKHRAPSGAHLPGTLQEHPRRKQPRCDQGQDGSRPSLGRQDTKDNIMTQDTRIIDLTVSQLAEIIDRAVEESLSRRQSSEDNTARYVYGIKGIATLLGVSERQARNIKASGTISKAIRQQGRTIITDARLAMELFGGKRHS